jgi:hypothetical protein
VSHRTYTARLLREPAKKVTLTFEDKGEAEPGVWIGEWRMNGGAPVQVRVVPAQVEPELLKRGLENYRYEEDMDLLGQWDVDLATMDDGV